MLLLLPVGDVEGFCGERRAELHPSLDSHGLRRCLGFSAVPAALQHLPEARDQGIRILPDVKVLYRRSGLEILRLNLFGVNKTVESSI